MMSRLLDFLVYWWRRLDPVYRRGGRCGYCGDMHHSTNGYCDFTEVKRWN